MSWRVFGMLLVSAVGALHGAEPGVRHVVILSIDGLRVDAIEKACAGNLKALIRQGAYCPRMLNIEPSLTLPNHTSIFTGLDSPRHEVTFNEPPAAGHMDKPTIFRVAHQAGRSTGMFFSKDKFHYLAVPEDLDVIWGPPPRGKSGSVDASAAGVAGAFDQQWRKKPLDLVFIHFKEPDRAGHKHDWMSEEYLEAVKKADAAAGDLVRTLRQTGTWDQTALIVTSDHGGKHDHHWQDWPENRIVPWICVAPTVKPGQVIGRQLRVMDTAPTALALLGLSGPEGCDGKPIAEVLGASRSTR